MLNVPIVDTLKREDVLPQVPAIVAYLENDCKAWHKEVTKRQHDMVISKLICSLTVSPAHCVISRLVQYKQHTEQIEEHTRCR